MQRIRRALKLAVIMFLGSIAALAVAFPAFGVMLAVVAIIVLAKQKPTFTSHGTARWAEAEDLEDMIDE